MCAWLYICCMAIQLTPFTRVLPYILQSNTKSIVDCRCFHHEYMFRPAPHVTNWMRNAARAALYWVIETRWKVQKLYMVFHLTNEVCWLMMVLACIYGSNMFQGNVFWISVWCDTSAICKSFSTLLLEKDVAGRSGGNVQMFGIQNKLIALCETKMGSFKINENKTFKI